MGRPRVNIERLAKLARISISAQEAPALSLQLEAMMDYVERLQDLCLEDVPEFLSVAQPESALRSDIAVEKDPSAVAEMRAGFPQMRGDFVTVAKMKLESPS